jgi:hypothetical protein
MPKRKPKPNCPRETFILCSECFEKMGSPDYTGPCRALIPGDMRCGDVWSKTWCYECVKEGRQGLRIGHEDEYEDDFLIIDDPVNPDRMELSEEYRQALRNWYKECMLRMEKKRKEREDAH